MKTTYIINITTASNRSTYLHRAYAKRITRTRHASNARVFLTAQAAQAFIDQNSIYFGGKWSVVENTPTASK